MFAFEIKSEQFHRTQKIFETLTEHKSLAMNRYFTISLCSLLMTSVFTSLSAQVSTSHKVFINGDFSILPNIDTPEPILEVGDTFEYEGELYDVVRIRQVVWPPCWIYGLSNESTEVIVEEVFDNNTGFIDLTRPGAPQPIPTLGTWSLIIMSILLTIISTVYIRQQRLSTTKLSAQRVI
jgi:hypothetical protein